MSSPTTSQGNTLHYLSVALVSDSAAKRKRYKKAAYDACFSAGLLVKLESCYRIGCGAVSASTVTRILIYGNI